VRTAVLETLAKERAKAGGTPLPDQQLGCLPENDTVFGSEVTMYVWLPEPVSIELADALEARPSV